MSKLKQKTQRINDILEDFMGTPENKWVNSDPLKSLVKTILSQNTNDKNRDRAFQSMKEKYSNDNGELDWDQIVNSPQIEFAESIRVGGLANQKSKRIQNILKWIKETYGEYNIDFICDKDPQEIIDLFTQLKGIGVKTISVVLAFSCDADVFPVDTHVNRLCHRLGLVPKKYNAEKTFWGMQDLVPSGKSFSLHLNLIRFGRRICKSRNPKCEECPLTNECRYYSEIIQR